MWKKNQINKAILALGLLLVIILLGKIITFFYQLAQPFNLSVGEKRQYSLDSSVNTNLVLASLKNPADPAIFLLSFSPKDNRLTLLHLSSLIYTSLPKELGLWRLGSIYELGQEENPHIGAPLLKLSLSKLVGLPVDGMIIDDEFSNKAPEQIFREIRKNPLMQFQFLGAIRTDLTPLELLKLVGEISSVRADRVISLDLASSSITESTLLPDSTRVLGVNTIKLDVFIRDNMADSNFIDEAKTIAIFNATTHPGLAFEASRFVGNLGGNVVILSTLDHPQDRSEVVVEDGSKKSITNLRLAQFFAPDCIQKLCLSNDPKVLSSRAQINIILGEEFYHYWHKN